MIDIKETHARDLEGIVRVQSDPKGGVWLSLPDKPKVLLDSHKARLLAAVLSGYADKADGIAKAPEGP